MMGYTSTTIEPVPDELRQRAWKVLVKELGLVDALRYVMAIEPGQGDSVVDFAEHWKDKSVDEIHKEILQAKEQGRI